ncbi:MAG: RNA methyltransferase substrate-binding domain-containing protein, partial [Oscillospiraceae bacterium]
MEERQNLIPEGLVAGRNPVTELLRSGKPVDKIWMIEPQGSLLRIRAIAREQDIPVKEVTREKLDAICKGLNHQGVAAQIAACQY